MWSSLTVSLTDMVTLLPEFAFTASELQFRDCAVTERSYPLAVSELRLTRNGRSVLRGADDGASPSPQLTDHLTPSALLRSASDQADQRGGAAPDRCVTEVEKHSELA